MLEEARKWLIYWKNYLSFDEIEWENGRGEWTRTTGLFVPNEAR